MYYYVFPFKFAYSISWNGMRHRILSIDRQATKIEGQKMQKLKNTKPNNKT